MTHFVAIIVATYHRVPELKRLFTSLAGVKTPFVVLVVDNANDPATEEAVRCSGVDACWLAPGGNLGCGGGLAFGERAALERFGDRLTHLWVLDDDTVVHEGALEALIAAMSAVSAESAAGAALACPMILDPRGQVGWPPGLQNRAAMKEIETGALDRARFLARHGEAVIPFSWATGISLLIAREVIEELGPHRDDFWIRGEDLEFSLRITARFPGIYVPAAVVEHLPPAGGASPQGAAAERIKHEAMLQNAAYISAHLPYGRKICKHLPGNLWRYVKIWGVARLPDALKALWLGGVKGLPAGATRNA